MTAASATDRDARASDDEFAGLPGERLRYLAARTLGLRVISDLHERAGDFGLAFFPGRRRRGRLAAIRQAGTLFVHIPKNAGQSVSMALYGLQVQHATVRYYAAAAPDIVRLPSFAILRDPVERFVSAYRYGLAGGASDNRIAPGFRRIYRHFRSLDDALDHVEAAASPYEIDHIFRPQSWYVTDRGGAIAVDRLYAFTDLPQIGALVPQIGEAGIGYLNRGSGSGGAVSAGSLDREQIARIERLYARDVALIAAVRAESDQIWRGWR